MDLLSFLNEGKILEIGPLANPFLKRPEWDVYYADINTTERIQELYTDYIDLNKIIEIDYPIGNRSYKEVVGNTKFAGVFSSHCLEHIPDIIRHLIEISEILDEGGCYILRIPDKRNCFDFFREVTSFRDAYDVYISHGKGINRLCAESAMLTLKADPSEYFSNSASFLLYLINENTDLAKRVFESQTPTDILPMCHIWVFTYTSMLAFLRDCYRFNLLPFSVEYHNSMITETLFDIEIVLRKNSSIAFVENSALATAYANDCNADYVFAQQVYAYTRKNDCVLGISTSGNSKNIVNAFETAKIRGAYTIALTGLSGGRLKAICDIRICVPEIVTYKIQEFHLPIYHTICLMLESHFWGESGLWK